MRQRFGAALCAMVLGISAGAYAAGETPGNPISLEVGASAEGETSRAAFYRVTPSRSGMLVVSLAPEGADLDLAVMGPGGNPTVESRRGGMEAEEATLQATAGTEYIVRVTSAAGRFGRYHLKAEMRGSAAAPTARPSAPMPSAPSAMMPGASMMPGMGMTPGMMTPGMAMPGMTMPGMAMPSAELETAPNLPLGYFVPDQITEPKIYRLQAPMGMAVSVVLRPVMGDPSLEVRSVDGALSGSSARAGMLPEEVEIPAGNSGWFEVKVTPGADGTARFYLGSSPRAASSTISPMAGMGMGMENQGMGMMMNPWMMNPNMMNQGQGMMMMPNPWMTQGWGMESQNPWMMQNPWMWQQMQTPNPGWGWR